MLRRLGPLLGLLAVSCALAAFVVEAADAADRTHLSAKSASAAVDIGVLEDLNQIRAAHHLVPLTLSPNLSAAASLHSREMLANGFFEHNSGNGQVFWKRIKAFYPEGRFSYWSVGENLFWTTGSASAAGSMKAWMASPEHRANILNPVWRQIGISSITSADAPGTFGNTDATVITTDFGVRR
jgi:uncharacterized protein YkwD